MRLNLKNEHAAKGRPLLLSPAFVDYLWGGTRLRTEYGKVSDMNPLAESWELSCHPNGPCTIENGPYAGKQLLQYLRENPSHLFAGAAPDEAFPLLIKFIDAQQALSIQVHPDDAYARRVEHSFGKTEMWYVVDAQEGAGIYYGFRRPVSREQVRAAIESDTITDLLNWTPAKKGDVFFIPAGTVHAIGAGLLIAEVQQSSDITYRFYDFGRRVNGKLRELHVDKALDVALLASSAFAVGPTEPPYWVTGGMVQPLVRCSKFVTEAVVVSSRMPCHAGRESFHSLLSLEGTGVLVHGGERLEIRKGQSVFVPAGMGDYALEGDMRLLRTTL